VKSKGPPKKGKKGPDQLVFDPNNIQEKKNTKQSRFVRPAQASEEKDSITKEVFQWVFTHRN